MSLLGTIVNKTTNTQINDQVIATDLIMGAKSAASAYLMATLESATPELRALLSAHLSQTIEGHAALTALAVSKNWYKPYDMPNQQLMSTLQQSQTIVPAQS